MPETGTPSLAPDSQFWPSADQADYPFPAPGTHPGYTPLSPRNAPKNGAGIAALVAAIAGIVTAVTVIGGVALGLAAVVLGFIGRGRVKRREADNGAVAIAGIVLGTLATVAGIGCIAFYIATWRSTEDYIDCVTKAGTDTGAQQQCNDRIRKHLENPFGGDTPMVQEESDSDLMPA